MNMYLHTILLQKWHDVYMKWNPDDFGGITTVRLESEQVWVPDIMLYNT